MITAAVKVNGSFLHIYGKGIEHHFEELDSLLRGQITCIMTTVLSCT